MSVSKSILTLLTMTLWLTQGVAVSETANPYSVIAKRNVFGLKPPPPPAAPPVEPPKEDPPPEVRITGITTLLGIRRALMKVQVPAKPPEPAREEGYILVEGGPGEGGIKVLQIFEDEEKVRIENRGVVQTLELVKDTPKKPAVHPKNTALAKAGRTGIPQPPKVLPSKTLPTRTVRTRKPGVPITPGSMTLNNRQASSSGQIPRSQRYVQLPKMTREEQVILMELQREQNRQNGGAGMTAPIPITPMSPQ